MDLRVGGGLAFQMSLRIMNKHRKTFACSVVMCLVTYLRMYLVLDFI